ncbi:hypothetical protein D3C71_1369800 [compost metagenome]
MRLHDFPNQRQAETRASGACRGERFKQGVAQVVGHTDTVIGHPQEQVAARAAASAQCDRAALGRVRQRVQQQVVEHSRHLHRIEPCAGLIKAGLRRHGLRQAHSGFLGRRRVSLTALIQECGKIERLALDTEGLGQGQQAGHQGFQAFGLRQHRLQRPVHARLTHGFGGGQGVFNFHAHGAQRVAYLVRQPRRHAAKGRQPFGLL